MSYLGVRECHFSIVQPFLSNMNVPIKSNAANKVFLTHMGCSVFSV